MRKIMRGRWYVWICGLGVELACAGLLSGSAYGASPVVHRVTKAPALSPLPMLTGGRMLVMRAEAENGFGDHDYTYQWPGAYFRAAFEGTSVYFRVVRGKEILHVVVDGEEAAPLVKPEPGVYEAEDLKPGRHAVEVLVATENQENTETFGGFGIPAGERPLRPVVRHRQMEFIGDSFTVGYGNLSHSRACTHDQVWADTDDTQAFGALTAAHYGADYQVNASSGRGVVRNYNGSKADLLPQTYPYVLFDRKQVYRDAGWKPDVVVVSLGTNDFSTPLHAGEPWKTRAELHADYEAKYVQFLEGLRKRDPQALLIVWGTDTTPEVEPEAAKVVARMKARGDRRIVDLPVNGLSFTGCDGHPSQADDRVIAEKLESVIDSAAH